MAKERKMKGRHDSAGQCEYCGWALDQFGQCTNPEAEHDEDYYGYDVEDDE